MRARFLSVCVMLFSLYGTEGSAYITKNSSRKANPPLRPIVATDQNQTYVINSRNLWDGRSFAEVVKGDKKTDTSTDKKESKKEKKQKKRKEILLQPKMNFQKDERKSRKVRQNEAGEFSKRYQASMNKGNKKHQSVHKGKLYNAR